MYGAISGDIIGSRFEFDRGGKTKDFELFTSECDFTDDTVMTVAVADGLMKAGKDADLDTIHEEVIKTMKNWGKIYTDAGFGGMFYRWLFWEKETQPYNSFGNGSGMRVSRAGWLYDTIERTREVAKRTAEVTHNHPEGIKGAECTAAVIFLARTGSSKEEIKEYVIKEFGYDFTETLDQMRKRHEHVETCQDSLPKALKSFFDGESFEDVIRNAVSLGGDTDTIRAIAGSMAEAFYGLPVMVKVKADEYLPEDMRKVTENFHEIVFPKQKDDGYSSNGIIKVLVENFKRNPCGENIDMMVNCLIGKALEGALVPTPMVDKNNVLGAIDVNDIALGKDFVLEQELRLKVDFLADNNGGSWVPVYTDEAEIDAEKVANITVPLELKNLFSIAAEDDSVAGIVINPFSSRLELPKDVVMIINNVIQKEPE